MGAWRNGRRNGLKKLSFVGANSTKVSSQIQGKLSLSILKYVNPEPRSNNRSSRCRDSTGTTYFTIGKERVQFFSFFKAVKTKKE